MSTNLLFTEKCVINSDVTVHLVEGPGDQTCACFQTVTAEARTGRFCFLSRLMRPHVYL